MAMSLSSCDLKAHDTEQAIKVACVGNSITYGSAMANRERNAYPKQLQAVLGDDRFEVRNFGVSGATLLENGNRPYYKTKAYQEALDFKPDVVLIKLGTNDSKRVNRPYYDEFINDYKSIISEFKKQNNQARIVLILPLPSFAKDSTQIWDPVIRQRIIPMIQQVAYETKSEIIDLYQLFVDREHLLPDKIHPSSLGAAIMARRLYEVVMADRDQTFDLIASAQLKNTRKSSFYGFQQYDFEINGVHCKIVQPKSANKNHHWIWRARFWGHEPQTDIALLERGFHVVYCDVSNLYGSKKAIERWNSFYQLVQKAGLHNKVALEGMSRGGLIIYNWALANPDKVSCVYADAPVLDGKSWPGGLGKGKFSDIDWKGFKQVYQLKTEQSIKEFKGNPIDQTKKIAQAGFPMLHVCGVEDKVVPVDENTSLFEKKIKAEGGNIKVIYKEGVDHHPHSLKNPQVIVDFILKAAHVKTNFAVIPSPGAEYRSGAGWKTGKGWWYQKNDIDSLCLTQSNIDLLLLGNSITQSWGGNRTFVTHRPGHQALTQYLGGVEIINAGISGDRTEHIAYRILHGHFEKTNPTYISLAIGVNNFPYNSAEEIALGIEMNLQLLRSKIPDATIILTGPLPAGLKKHDALRVKYNKVHQIIKKLGQVNKVQYVNLLSYFSNEDGSLNESYVSADGIHLKPAGYEVWAQFLKKSMSD